MSDTPEFESWFGDSQVVDEEGNPRVLYHGTRSPVTEFAPSRIGNGSLGMLGDYTVERHGIFAAEDPGLAQEFAEQGGETAGAAIQPLHLKIENPLDLTERYAYNDGLFNAIEAAAQKLDPSDKYHGFRAAQQFGELLGRGQLWKIFDKGETYLLPEQWIGILKGLGYDGMAIWERSEGDVENTKTWVAFDPAQVKSKFNQAPTESADITAEKVWRVPLFDGRGGQSFDSKENADAYFERAKREGKDPSEPEHVERPKGHSVQDRKAGIMTYKDLEQYASRVPKMDRPASRPAVSGDRAMVITDDGHLLGEGMVTYANERTEVMFDNGGGGMFPNRFVVVKALDSKNGTDGAPNTEKMGQETSHKTAYTDKMADLVQPGQRVLLHGTTLSNARKILEQGVVPSRGKWTSKFHGEGEPLAFGADMSDDPDNGGSSWPWAVFRAMRFHVAQESGQAEAEVTLPEIVERGAILEVVFDTLHRAVPGYEDSEVLHETPVELEVDEIDQFPQAPTGTEANDLYSREVGQPVGLIAGEDLRAFIVRHMEQWLEVYPDDKDYLAGMEEEFVADNNEREMQEMREALGSSKAGKVVVWELARIAKKETLRFTELSPDTQDNITVSVHTTHYLKAQGEEEGCPTQAEVLDWLKETDPEIPVGKAKVSGIIAQMAEEHWGTHTDDLDRLVKVIESGEALDHVLLDGDRLVDGAHRSRAAHEVGLEELDSLDIGPLLKKRPDIKGKKAEAAAQKAIAVDFDDTIAYENEDRSIGEPVPGAKEALVALREAGHRIEIFSCRAHTPEGEKEISEYLSSHGIPFDSVITGDKPAHALFVDDNAVEFGGDWSRALESIMGRDEKHKAKVTWELVRIADAKEAGMGWLRVKATDEMTLAYLEAALFSENDNADPETGGNPLDQNYSIEDFSPDSLANAQEDCEAFSRKAAQWIRQMPAGVRLEQLGHDFWLTRNGHGTGFWDRPELYGEQVAEQLTAISEEFGQVDVLVGDDGLLYIEGGKNLSASKKKAGADGDYKSPLSDRTEKKWPSKCPDCGHEMVGNAPRRCNSCGYVQPEARKEADSLFGNFGNKDNPCERCDDLRFVSSVMVDGEPMKLCTKCCDRYKQERHEVSPNAMAATGESASDEHHDVELAREIGDKARELQGREQDEADELEKESDAKALPTVELTDADGRTDTWIVDWTLEEIRLADNPHEVVSFNDLPPELYESKIAPLFPGEPAKEASDLSAGMPSAVPPKPFSQDTPLEASAEEDEIPEGPAPEDYLIGSSGPLGSRYSVGQVEGKHLGEFNSWDEAADAIRAKMEKERFWPSVWEVSDHGNISPVSL